MSSLLLFELWWRQAVIGGWGVWPYCGKARGPWKGLIRELTHKSHPHWGRVEPCDDVEDRLCSEAGRTVGKLQSKGGEGLGSRDRPGDTVEVK